MATVTCPALSVEEDLMRELRELARATQMSQEDMHRQALRLGLPQVRARLLGIPPELLEPIPAAELDRYYSRPDEFEEQVSPAMLRATQPKEEPT